MRPTQLMTSCIMTKRHPRHREHGTLLLGILWITVFLLLTIVGYMPFLITLLRTTVFTYMRDRSMAIAEAGLARAQWEIINAPHNLDKAPWQTIAYPAPGTCDDEIDGNADGNLYGLAVNSCYYLERTLNSGDAANAPIGTMRVWVVNYGSSIARILARGTAPNAASATREIRLDLERAPGPRSNYVAYSGTQLYIGNIGDVQIDSYDSRNGAYGGTNIADHADIGTNGNGIGAVDVWIPNSSVVINGKGTITSGDSSSVNNPPNQPTGGFSTIIDIALPDIIIPTSLTSLTKSTGALTDTNGRSLTDLTGQGDYRMSGGQTWTCDGAYRFNSLAISGEFQMTDNCQLFVDRDPASTWAGALDTNGSGRLLKTGTGTNAIYTREGFVNLDGQGIMWSDSISEAQRYPEKLQLYVDCPNGCGDLALMQSKPFYGVVYAKGVNGLGFGYGSENGVLSETTYYGAFISTAPITINGRDSQGLIGRVHYDEALRDLLIDGSGVKSSYSPRSGSWFSK